VRRKPNLLSSCSEASLLQSQRHCAYKRDVKKAARVYRGDVAGWALDERGLTCAVIVCDAAVK
jgi:hypothetical protein